MQSPLLEQIEQAKDLLNKAQNKLNSSITKLENKNINGAVKDLIDYEVQSEKIVNQARLLPNYTGLDYTPVIEKNIITENNVKIDVIENNWLYIKLPFILPKKEKGSASYIRATIQTGFKNYLRDHQLERISSNSVLIVQHVYDKSVKEKNLRDHDNIELNVIIDAIALYSLVDDSPLLLKHYYTTKIEDSFYTNIYIVPVSDFSYWLDKYENLEQFSCMENNK